MSRFVIIPGDFDTAFEWADAAVELNVILSEHHNLLSSDGVNWMTFTFVNDEDQHYLDRRHFGEWIKGADITVLDDMVILNLEETNMHTGTLKINILPNNDNFASLNEYGIPGEAASDMIRYMIGSFKAKTNGDNIPEIQEGPLYNYSLYRRSVDKIMGVIKSKLGDDKSISINADLATNDQTIVEFIYQHHNQPLRIILDFECIAAYMGHKLTGMEYPSESQSRITCDDLS